MKKTPCTYSKAVFLEIFRVQKYETSLETCFPRNIRLVLLKVLNAESFSLNIATVIVGQLEVYSINLKNFYLLFLVELWTVDNIKL